MALVARDAWIVPVSPSLFGRAQILSTRGPPLHTQVKSATTWLHQWSRSHLQKDHNNHHLQPSLSSCSYVDHGNPALVQLRLVGKRLGEKQYW